MHLFPAWLQTPVNASLTEHKVDTAPEGYGTGVHFRETNEVAAPSTILGSLGPPFFTRLVIFNKLHEAHHSCTTRADNSNKIREPPSR